MIFGDLKDIENYPYLPEVATRCLHLLKDFDGNKYTEGRNDIEGDKIYLNLDKIKTNDLDRYPEVHKEYIDIHFLIKGEEKIYFSNFNEENKIYKNYDEKGDFYFLERMKDSCELIMKPGMFALFFPEEPHMPGCPLNDPMDIEKIVFKIHKSLLGL